MSKSQRQPFFADPVPKKKPLVVVGDGFGETLSEYHPFRYAFLAQPTPSEKPADASEQDKPKVKSTYELGIDTLALAPEKMPGMYYEQLDIALRLLTQLDWSQAKTDSQLRAYHNLPSYDLLYRRATHKKVVQTLRAAYGTRYEKADLQLNKRQSSKIKITSLLQSYIFLDEFVWITLAQIFKDLTYERIEGEIYAWASSFEYTRKQQLERWCATCRFESDLQFSDGDSIQDQSVPVHNVSVNHANQSCKLFFMRRLVSMKKYGGFEKIADDVISKSLNTMVSLVDAEDRHGVKAGLQDEIKRAHKSFYAVHELLFIK